MINVFLPSNFGYSLIRIAISAIRLYKQLFVLFVQHPHEAENSANAADAANSEARGRVSGGAGEQPETWPRRGCQEL